MFKNSVWPCINVVWFCVLTPGRDFKHTKVACFNRSGRLGLFCFEHLFEVGLSAALQSRP